LRTRSHCIRQVNRVFVEHNAQARRNKSASAWAIRYSSAKWRNLEADIRQYHLESEVDTVRETPYGTRYEIHDILKTSSGRTLNVRTIWQIDQGTDFPRLIRLYPDQRKGGTMDFPLYTDVVLTHDIFEEGLRAGDVGTVLERHDVAGLETGYSLEFFDMLGNTVAVVTVPASWLRLPTHADRPAVRFEHAPA
jgi:hypothetical protein